MNTLNKSPTEVVFPPLPEPVVQVFIGHGTEYVYTAAQMRAYALEALVSMKAVGSGVSGLTLIGQMPMPEGGQDGYVCRVYATTSHIE